LYAFLCGFIAEPISPANKHTTLSLNLADVARAGQYASYIGAGKCFTLGCIAMQRYMNPTLTMLTGVQTTFPV